MNPKPKSLAEAYALQKKTERQKQIWRDGKEKSTEASAKENSNERK